MSTILLALGNFHRWLDSDPAIQLMATTINNLLNRHLVDGFEVGYSAADLTRHNGLLPERFASLPVFLHSRIINSLYSIHLPSLGHLDNDQKHCLAQSVRHAYEGGLCTEFTIHPDNTSFEDWRKFLQHIPRGAVISVENMDKDKRTYRTLPELMHLLDRFHKLQVTFDICHWLELGYESDCDELLQFIREYRERISKVHFSAPGSHASWYNNVQGKADNHNLVANSGWQIMPAFYQAVDHIPFVMEGGIPVGCVEAIVSEVALIRDNRLTRPAVRESIRRVA